MTLLPTYNREIRSSTSGFQQTLLLFISPLIVCAKKRFHLLRTSGLYNEHSEAVPMSCISRVELVLAEIRFLTEKHSQF